MNEAFVYPLVNANGPWASLSKAVREGKHGRFLQGEFGVESVMSSTLGDLCAFLIETSKEDDGIDCACHLSDSGEMLLTCTSRSCTLCDERRHVCAQPSLRYNLNTVMNFPTSESGETFILEYISGDRDDRIEIEMVGCDSMSNFCSECRASIENKECNSCLLCGFDQFEFDIDCENVSENSSFTTCDSSVPIEDEHGFYIGGVKVLECVTSPPNANCTGANSPMFPNNQVILGSTVTSKYDGQPECLEDRRSPGLWYMVIGTGDTFRVDTCSNHTNFDTKISLYRGVCGVQLECMGGNDDSCSGVTSALQWKTEIGVLYYVKVHGHGRDDVGNFGLTFSSLSSPPNEMCSGAEFLPIGASDRGSTVGAAAIYDNAPTCGASNAQLFPGIWYTVQGNGKAIMASTCGPATETSTSISVYSGSCDGNLVCETNGSQDYSCLEGNVGATATWFASDGTDYYIQVLSEDGFGGRAEVKIAESPNLENNFCQTALEVFSDDIETVGSLNFTFGGQIVEPEVSCGYTFESAGAWYTVVGDGGVLSASTCSSTLSFDSSLSIFRGSCDTLTCIGWNSAAFDSSPNSSHCIMSGNFFSGTVNWRTQAGEVYYILVQGIDSSPNQLEGDFSLSIASVDVPANDLCVRAETMNLSDKFQATGTTIMTSQDQSIREVNIEKNNNACRTISSGGDLWYRVPGSGSLLKASTCHPETNFDSQISVYESHSSTSSCDELECISTNDDDDVCEINPSASTMSWFAEEGVSYLIRIHGFDQSAGDFVLTLSSDSP